MKNTFLIAQIIIGLSVVACPVHGQPWTPTSAPATYWGTIVCSADGAKVAAFYADLVCTSTNSGISWVSNHLPPHSYCESAACSSDGSMVIAGMSCGGIYTSTNSGAAWISNNVPFGNWSAVATSADGRKSAALGWHNLVYTSTNSGITWTSNSVPLPLDLVWMDLASSADGTKLAAAGMGSGAGGPLSSGGICISTNSGATWKAVAAPSTHWTSIACSADGSRLVAGAYDRDNYPWRGDVFTSIDSGKTWCLAAGCGPLYEMVSVACSEDGSKMIVVAGRGDWPGPIYTSTDSGTSWKSNSTPRAVWGSVACSADGSRMVAAAWPGQVFAWEAVTPLTMVAEGKNVILSWPSLCASDGFGLQESSDLTMTNWTAVTDSVVSNTGQFRVMLSRTGNKTFFRLKRP